MSDLHGAELRDTIEANRLPRFRAENQRLQRELRQAKTMVDAILQDAAGDVTGATHWQTYARVRAACSPFSVLSSDEMDEHAARITLDVLAARRNPRNPSPHRGEA